MGTVRVWIEVPSADGAVATGCSAGPVFERVAVRESGVWGPRREVYGQGGSVFSHRWRVGGFGRGVGWFTGKLQTRQLAGLI